MDQIHADLQHLSTQFSGIFGLCARKIGSTESIQWNSAESFPAASVIKLPILVACLHQVQRGQLSLDEPVTLQAEDRVIGSGVLKALRPGITLTLEDLLVLMIAISDNTATNMVLDRVPPAQVNTLMAHLGCTATISVGKLFRSQGKGFSRTTPQDMAHLLAFLAAGASPRNHQTLAQSHATSVPQSPFSNPESTFLAPVLCRKAMDILARQQYTEILTRYLPYDPFNLEEGSPAAVKVASKSGFIRGVRNDVGLITTSMGTYAIALMSKGCADRRFHADNEANLFLARVSRRVYDCYHPSSGG
jgi:beta-lactamase class A